MKCVNPLVKTPEGWALGKANIKGKTYWLGKKGMYADNECVRYPCRKCVYCLQARAQEWSIRATKEMLYHKSSCILTITYDDKNNTGTLSKNDCQLFIDRLRKSANEKIKYILVGEYGTNTARPHYHAIIYGYCPQDLQKLGTSKALYFSNILNNIWGKGCVAVDPLPTLKAIKYVCGYTLSKLISINAKLGVKTFMLASRRPAIGKIWFDENKHKLISDDKLYFDGKQSRIGEYYTKKVYEIVSEDQKLLIMQKRSDMIVKVDYVKEAETNYYRSIRLIEQKRNKRNNI